MEVPKKIVVDESRRHQPAGYSDSEYDDDDDLYDYSDNETPKINNHVVITSPPEKLILPQVNEEERRRNLKENPNYDVSFTDDKTFMNIGDNSGGNHLIGLSRQVRHLHNRVKLLEEELTTQNSRQIFLFGILSVYFLTKVVKLIH